MSSIKLFNKTYTIGDRVIIHDENGEFTGTIDQIGTGGLNGKYITECVRVKFDKLYAPEGKPNLFCWHRWFQTEADFAQIMNMTELQNQESKAAELVNNAELVRTPTNSETIKQQAMGRGLRPFTEHEVKEMMNCSPMFISVPLGFGKPPLSEFIQEAIEYTEKMERLIAEMNDYLGGNSYYAIQALEDRLTKEAQAQLYESNAHYVAYRLEKVLRLIQSDKIKPAELETITGAEIIEKS